jgi:hypothetical protein
MRPQITCSGSSTLACSQSSVSPMSLGLGSSPHAPSCKPLQLEEGAWSPGQEGICPPCVLSFP